MRVLSTRELALLLTTGVLVCKGALAQSPSPIHSFEFDALGNLIVERNGLLHAAKHEYDALSRLKATLDPKLKKTQFAFDLADQLKAVTDPRNAVTTYLIDGLGKLTQTTSADTGAATSEYDEAGNLVLRIDAKQQSTRFEYDALNRIKLITYADATTAAYTYDQGLNAIGRLSKIVDTNGSIEYHYDRLGNVLFEMRSIAGTDYTTGYRYDTFGRLSGMDYPSGRRIDYEYDALGQVARITTQKAGVTKLIVNEASYQPFGGISKIVFGNGKSHTRTYDLDGRIDSYTLRNQKISLGYDAGNRLRRVAHATTPAIGTDFQYDEVNRLTGVSNGTMSQVYGYDDAGNRTSKQINASVKSLGYAPASNRLVAVGAQQIVTDENGSITNRGDGTFKYDARGRLISFQSVAGLFQYTINSLGQRVRKLTPTASTVFHYDRAGQLIAESTTENGTTTTQEYVYLGDIPVAVLK